MRDLQWGKWRYLNIIREQGGLTMGEVEVFEYNQGAGSRVVGDLQWGKWRYLNIIREQGG